MSISIIIPAYNAAKTIARCLNSVLAQEDMQNIKEVLVIDDGSKDDTAEIVKFYEKKNPIIRLIQKVNEGVSSARNTGIRHASGEYIIFCDSDDEMMPVMCKRLYETLLYTEADLGICGYKEKSLKHSQSRIPQGSEQIKKFLIQDCFDDLFYGFYLNQPWNKIFKRDRIVHLFDESLQNGEDIKFILDYLSDSPQCAIISEDLYVVHTENEDSLSRQRINALKSTCDVQLCLWSFITNNKINTSFERFSDYCISLLWAPAVDGIMRNQFNSKEAASQINLSYDYTVMLHKLNPSGLVNRLTRIVALSRKYKFLALEFSALVYMKRCMKSVKKRNFK